MHRKLDLQAVDVSRRSMSFDLFRSVVSPIMSQNMSVRNAFGSRRFTEVNNSVMAGMKMREQ